MSRWSLCAFILLLLPLLATSQQLFKYKDENGKWVYSDRPPPEKTEVEIQDIQSARPRPTITMTERRRAGEVDLVAINTFEVPVEISLQITEAENLSREPGEKVHYVVGATTDEVVTTIRAIRPGNWSFAYEAQFTIGDPAAKHSPPVPYRAPFAVSSRYTISQAYPGDLSHQNAGNRYAVDFVMPVGTPVYSARRGKVVDIATHFFANGTDVEKDAPKANLVRIVHDDGSIAVYAHLNWDSIRVRIGQLVEGGEYIADSGNTGFSTGPHLHFDVQLNKGMELVSVPFVFRDQRGRGVSPRAGQVLTSYP